ncbi:MAG: hypothetical protein Q8O56_04585 [Solirubrobacteraceae bacterium]|nr:hypothetical protein [Solirubrobacteraceae bacterium]
MSPARCLVLLAAAVAAAVAAPTAAFASASGSARGWSVAQDILPNRCCASPVAIASNARGDAVAVFSEGGGLTIARARANRRFGQRVRIASASYSEARVAIDQRGVALVAFTFEDGSTPPAREDRFGMSGCCTGVRVVVWRPGQRPTTARAIFARGTSSVLGAVAATHGRRGVLVAGDPSRPEHDLRPTAPVRLVTVGLDGRIGARRTVANRSWTPTTLQWVGRRAVAGLMRNGGGGRLDLGIARQGSGSAFLPAKRFARFARVPDPLRGSEVEMTADGRGGQVAVWRRVTRSGLRLVVARASLGGQLRTNVVGRGFPAALTIAAPAVASDGGIVVPWGQVDADRSRSAHVTTRSPRGALATRRILAPTRTTGPGLAFDSLAAAAAPGGRGAVAVDRTVGFSARTRLVGLRGGRPATGTVLDLRTGPTGHRTLLTGNRRDPARALFEFTRVSPTISDHRVRERRLRP